MARRDEGAYLQYVTEEQRSQPGWIGREIDLSHSRALSSHICCRSTPGPQVLSFIIHDWAPALLKARRSMCGSTHYNQRREKPQLSPTECGWTHIRALQPEDYSAHSQIPESPLRDG
jgi:hypothetical protein